MDESQPYASTPMDYYTATKVEGEKLVLAANGTAGVQTVALRPSGIFGEGDPLFLPTLVSKVRPAAGLSCPASPCAAYLVPRELE